MKKIEVSLDFNMGSFKQDFFALSGIRQLNEDIDNIIANIRGVVPALIGGAYSSTRESIIELTNFLKVKGDSVISHLLDRVTKINMIGAGLTTAAALGLAYRKEVSTFYYFVTDITVSTGKKIGVVLDKLGGLALRGSKEIFGIVHAGIDVVVGTAEPFIIFVMENINKILMGVLGFGSAFIMGRFFFAETVDFFKNVITLGHRARTPLTDSKDILIKIADTFNMTTRIGGRSLMRIYHILGGMALSVNSMFFVFGSINLVLSSIGDYLRARAMKVGAFFGNAKAEMVLFFLETKNSAISTISYVRDFLKEVGKSISSRVMSRDPFSYIVSKAKSALTVLTGMGSNKGGAFRNLLPMIRPTINNMISGSRQISNTFGVFSRILTRIQPLVESLISAMREAFPVVDRIGAASRTVTNAVIKDLSIVSAPLVYLKNQALDLMNGFVIAVDASIYSTQEHVLSALNTVVTSMNVGARSAAEAVRFVTSPIVSVVTGARNAMSNIKEELVGKPVRAFKEGLNDSITGATSLKKALISMGKVYLAITAKEISPSWFKDIIKMPAATSKVVSQVSTISKSISDTPISKKASKLQDTIVAISDIPNLILKISNTLKKISTTISKLMSNARIKPIVGDFDLLVSKMSKMVSMMQQAKPIMEKAPKLVQIMFGSIGGLSRGLILMSKSITEIKNEMIGIESVTGKQRSYRDMLNIIVNRATKFVALAKEVRPIISELPGVFTKLERLMGGLSSALLQVTKHFEKIDTTIKSTASDFKEYREFVRETKEASNIGNKNVLTPAVPKIKIPKDQVRYVRSQLGKLRYSYGSLINAIELTQSRVETLFQNETPRTVRMKRLIASLGEVVVDNLVRVLRLVEHVESKLVSMQSVVRFRIEELRLLGKILNDMLNSQGKAFDINKTLEPLSGVPHKLKKIRSDKIGRELISQISTGMRFGFAEIEETTKKTALIITDYFPQSPAKKGPLKKLTTMGAKIIGQIAQGMSSGVGYVTKAAGFIAESIARFFPRSPALVGALVLLSPMGRKIPFYIAHGMYSGISYVLSAAKKLTTLLHNQFKKSFDNLKSIFKNTFVMDESFTAVSKLSNVLKISGSSIDSLSFMMRKLKKDGGDVKTALLDVAEALESNKDGYEGRAAILEKAGIMATSTILPALSQGRQHLQRVFDLVERGSAGISKLAGSYVRAKTAYNAYLDILKTSFFGEIYAGMSSYMDAAAKSMEKVVTKYTIIIRTLGNIIGTLAGEALSVLTSIADLVVSKPSKAFVSLRVIFVKFTKLAGEDFKKFIKASVTTASTFIMLSSIGLFKTIVTFGSTFADELTNNSVSNFGNGIKVIKKSVMAVVNMIKKALKGILDYVTKIVSPVVDLVDMAKEVKAGAEVAKKNTTNFFTDMILGEAPKYIGPHQAKNEKSIDVKKNAIIAPVKIVPPTAGEVKDATKVAIDAAVEEFQKGMSESFKAFENAGPSQEYLDGLKKRSEDFFGTVKGEITKLGGEETLNKINTLMNSLMPSELIKKWNETRRAIQKATSLSSAATALEEKRRKDKEKETKMWQTSKSTMDEFGTAMSDMYEMTGKKHKEFFYMSKAIAIADATIKGANAIQTAMTYGWPGYAMIPFIASTTAINIAKIASSGFFAGGRVTTGSEYEDSVPAMLAKDEFVINNRAAKKYGFGMLSDINNLRFADPRQVARNSAIKEAARAADGSSKGGMEVTIVNFVEKTAMKTYLASKEAGTIIVNHIGQNKNQVKKILA